MSFKLGPPAFWSGFAVACRKRALRNDATGADVHKPGKALCACSMLQANVASRAPSVPHKYDERTWLRHWARHVCANAGRRRGTQAGPPPYKLSQLGPICVQALLRGRA